MKNFSTPGRFDANYQPYLARPLLLLLLLVSSYSAYAQQPLNFTTYGGQSGYLTYNDLGTTGTVITTANTDDANSAPQNIGFSFGFNGQTFTQFVLNTNGYIKLGSQNPSTNYYYDGAQTLTGGPVNSTDAADVNLILPFNADLVSGTSAAEYRIAVSGTAPNRICTIQWKNVSDKARNNIGVQFTNFSFQVRLFETTNVIDFAYGPVTLSTTAASTDFKTVAVGLKGSGAANNQILSATDYYSSDWGDADFVQGSIPSFFATDLYPDALTTGERVVYRFTPALANDAGVLAIYTLGKIASPASPHAVQAAIANQGYNALANVTVTLTVAGATTFTSTKTISALPINRYTIVTFDTYPVVAVGTNNITVTVSSDDAVANNQQTFSQQVTTNQFSYLDATKAANIAISYGIASGQLAVKYQTKGPATVTAITPTFAQSANNNNEYRLILYDATGTNGAPGTALYTSSVLARTPAAGAVPLTVPNIAVNGTFYAAIAERQDDAYIGLAAQIEDPLRPTTFYANNPNTGAWMSLENTGLNVYRLGLDVTFGTTTAVNQALSNSITAYPNPTSGLLNLDLRASSARTVQATLVNALGQTVLTRSFSNNKQPQVDVSQLAAGVYTLRLELDGATAVKRVSILK